MLVVFVGIILLAPNVSRNANGLGRTDVNGDEPEAARKAKLTFARLTSGWLAGPCRLVTRRAHGGRARCPAGKFKLRYGHDWGTITGQQTGQTGICRLLQRRAAVQATENRAWQVHHLPLPNA